jgi:hypothetical protein
MKKITVLTLATLSLFMLTGCEIKKKDTKKEETTKPEQTETTKPEQTEATPTETTVDDYKIEVSYSKVEENDDEFYKVIVSVNDNVIGSFEEYDEDEVEDIIKNYKTSKIKGKDNKEYLILTFDSGSIPKEKLYITNGVKLIVYLECEENLAGILSNNDKYEKDETGKTTKFYSIGNDKINYLTSNIQEATEGMTLDEYELTINNDVAAINRTNKSYTLTELDGGDSSFVKVEM